MSSAKISYSTLCRGIVKTPVEAVCLRCFVLTFDLYGGHVLASQTKIDEVSDGLSEYTCERGWQLLC